VEQEEVQREKKVPHARSGGASKKEGGGPPDGGGRQGERDPSNARRSEKRSLASREKSIPGKENEERGRTLRKKCTSRWKKGTFSRTKKGGLVYRKGRKKGEFSAWEGKKGRGKILRCRARKKGRKSKKGGRRASFIPKGGKTFHEPSP